LEAPTCRLVSAGLAGAGARRHHYSLLAALDEGGPASQAALSRRTTIDRSDMVATINELLERGLVDRIADPTDRRRKVVSITPAGRRELRRLDRLLAGVQDDFLAPLPAAERDRSALSIRLRSPIAVRRLSLGCVRRGGDADG
jgi:MarR family transcriptional regulator, lower aerobic nicotinate degradation pathway regulator